MDIFEAPREMWGAVRDLHHQIYGDAIPEDEFSWKYFDNPAGEATVWLAREGDLVCGSWSLFPAWLNLGNRTTACLQAGDLMVLPEFRRRRIFRSMCDASVRRLKGSRVTALIAFPDEQGQSYPGLVKFGWKNPATLGIYKRFVSLDRMILRRMPGIPTAIGAALTTLYNRPHVRRKAACGSMNLQIIHRFDGSFDALFRKPSGAAGIERTARYLNWKFIDKPGNRNTVFGLFHGHELRAYCVIHDDGERAEIVDLDFNGEIALGVLLLSYCITEAQRKGIAILSCACTPSLGRAFKKSGFVVRGRGARFMIHLIAESAALVGPWEWQLTAGDIDIA